MTCTEARAAMLDADTEELVTSAQTELARHIASCAECKALASAIVADTREIDDALTSLTSRGTAAVMTSHTDVIPIGSAVRVHHATRTRRLAVAAVLACVAVGAAALQREMAHRAGDAYPLYLPPLPVSAGPVNAGGTGAVAVLRTSNPKITVVWYLATQRGKS